MNPFSGITNESSLSSNLYVPTSICFLEEQYDAPMLVPTLALNGLIRFRRQGWILPHQEQRTRMAPCWRGLLQQHDCLFQTQISSHVTFRGQYQRVGLLPVNG